MNKYDFGVKGEDRAVMYLQSVGYEILARRFRGRDGEIDIVCVDPGRGGPELVFIEVKSRRATQFGRPEDAIRAPKVQRIYKTALAFVREHDWPSPLVRFDVVTVREGPSSVQLKHIIDAIDVQDLLNVA